MYLFSTSGPFTATKRMPAAATAAATMCVLPQPGGPYSSAPVRSRSGALRAHMLCTYTGVPAPFCKDLGMMNTSVHDG